MAIKHGNAACAAGFLGILLLSTFSGVDAAWVNATGNLSGMATECGDFQSVYAVPNSNLTTIGLANNGLYSTTNGGTSWTKMTGMATMRLMQMLFDPDHPDTWYAGGIYHTPGIIKTTDAGATWVGFNGIGTNDGFAVDFSDPLRKTILAGGHESQSNLYRSTDGGTTWTNIGCPGGGFSSFPYIVNTQTYLMGIQSVGMYRSINAGGAWTQVSTIAPLSHITKTAAGDLYYTGGGHPVRSTDNGATWTNLTTVSVAGAAPIEVPGGKIAVINGQGISFSADKGATWVTNRCSPLPSAMTSFWAFSAMIGLTYNTVTGTFFTFKWGCGNTVAADEVWSFDTNVSTGSEILMPPYSAAPGKFVDTQKDASIFDVTGRMVNRMAFIQGNRPGAVYILRTADGTLAKKIFRK